MRFQYSSKHYLVGLFLFLIVAVFGLEAIFDVVYKLPALFLFFLIFCVGMLHAYLKTYLSYRDKYIYLYYEGIIFGDRQNVTGLKRSEIDMVIEARHQQRIKLYTVMHIFLKDGRYTYFTTDVARYKVFSQTMASLYSDRFYRRHHLFPEGYVVTKENLLNEEI